MLSLPKGTKENLLVPVRDKLGALTTLSGADVFFDVVRSDGTFVVSNDVATSVGMTAKCYIDTTSWDEDAYSLFLRVSANSQEVALGPLKFVVEDYGLLPSLPPPPPPVGIVLVSPAENSVVTGFTTFTVRAYDPDGISGVIFYLGGYMLGTDTTGVNNEYSVVVDTTAFPNESMLLTADAYVAGSLTYSMTAASFFVSNLPPVTDLPPVGYNLVFEENWDAYDLVVVGDAHVVNTKWHDHIWYAGYPPSGTQYVLDGVLHLVSKRSDGYPQITMSTYHPAAAPQQTFQYGYFETRMRWTGGKGAWPAFWLFGQANADNPNYPAAPPGFPDPTVLAAELDILEVQGGTPDTFYGTLHKNTGGLWGVADDTKPEPNYLHLPAPFNDEWHIISALWTDTAITWYYDHQEVYSVTPYDSTPQPMMLILQMEIGGWIGTADDTTPDEMHAEFDYVRVYQLP